MAETTKQTETAAPAWDGAFTLCMQGLAAHAKKERDELAGFTGKKCYTKAPGCVQLAVMAAWHRADERLNLQLDCIASFTENWFDASAFQSSKLFMLRGSVAIYTLADMLEANADDPDTCEWLRSAPIHAELPCGGGAAPVQVITRVQ